MECRLKWHCCSTSARLVAGVIRYYGVAASTISQLSRGIFVWLSFVRFDDAGDRRRCSQRVHRRFSLRFLVVLVVRCKFRSRGPVRSVRYRMNIALLRVHSLGGNFRSTIVAYRTYLAVVFRLADFLARRYALDKSVNSSKSITKLNKLHKHFE